MKKINFSTSIVYLLTITFLLFFPSCADDTADQSGKADRDTATPQLSDTTKTITRANQQDPVFMNNSKLPRIFMIESEASRVKEGSEFVVRIRNKAEFDRMITEKKIFIWDTLIFARNMSGRDKLRITSYVYGFLTYHNMLVDVQGNVDTVYFDWHSRRQPDTLLLYIAPKPTKARLSDPPRPRVPPPPPMGID